MSQQSNVTIMTESLAGYNIQDMYKLPLEELTAKCAFLVKTTKPNLYVGVRFTPAELGSNNLVLRLAVVEDRSGNKVYTNLSSIAQEYDVVATYAAVGKIAMQFTQGLITWGDFLTAVQEVCGEIEG